MRVRIRRESVAGILTGAGTGLSILSIILIDISKRHDNLDSNILFFTLVIGLTLAAVGFEIHKSNK